MSLAQARVADAPWTRSDLRRSGLWATVGLVALVVCCVGISRTKTYDNQLLWTALGAISLAVGVLGGVRWILRGTRAVRRERRDVLLALAGVTEPVADELPVTGAGVAVYFTPAMSRFHTAVCPFARGKELVAASRREVGTRRPCEVCDP